MDFGAYTREALVTESKAAVALGRMDERKVRLLHAVIGISTEAGELLDAMKKHVFYQGDLDTINLGEEIGDLLWYVAILLDETGVPMAHALAKNIAKLRARYPEGFKAHDALHRDLPAERAVLEGSGA